MNAAESFSDPGETRPGSTDESEPQNCDPLRVTSEGGEGTKKDETRAEKGGR